MKLNLRLTHQPCMQTLHSHHCCAAVAVSVYQDIQFKCKWRMQARLVRAYNCYLMLSMYTYLNRVLMCVAKILVQG